AEHDRLRRELNEWAAAQTQTSPAVPAAEGGYPAALQTHLDLESPRPRPTLEITRLDRAWPATGGHAHGGSAHSGSAPSGAIGHSVPPPPHRAAALQVHNKYLIAESEDGVLVIDQHALHERILYEQLRTKLDQQSLETQSLLVPEPV